jgi:mRNA interferase MazF
MISPLRWAIVIVDFDPAKGHEQEGTRRALVVSYEAFHRSGMAAVCPISARDAKYPGEVKIPRGDAGQTKDAVILCHQVRTIDLSRVTAKQIGGQVQYVTSGDIRRRVREALQHQLGLDIPASADGAQ